MNPNYNQTLTLYNCLRAADNPEGKKDIWQKTVLHDCFYKSMIGRTEYADKNPRMDNTYTVRIPISEKDVVIKGECDADITGISPDTAAQVLLRHKPDAFVVTAFADNTSHRMAKHYRLGG